MSPRHVWVRFVHCLLFFSAYPPATTPLIAAPPAVNAERICAHLAAGEFGPARELVAEIEDTTTRDSWLSKIAGSQMQSGAWRASLRTAYSIRGDETRGSTFGQLAEYRGSQRPSRGGAALADFDTLIQLITTTVEPDSWDVVGGPGAIERFPTGVYVDAAGLLKRIEPGGEMSELTAIRRESRHRKGSRGIHEFSSLRKVSLTRLERHALMRWALGAPPDEAMSTLAGMHDVKYVMFYPETRDIVLAGPAGGWTTNHEGRMVSVDTGQPVLSLDDLIVVLRNAFMDRGIFGCAIAPPRENLAGVQSFLRDSASNPLRKSRRARWLADLRDRLGAQEISVFGIDPRTRVARILVEADYHMKLVGMGLAEGTAGVTSYLDSVTLGDDGNPPTLDVLRWWFTLNYEGIRTTPARDCFELVGPGVQVLCENELLGERGERIHTGRSEDLNRRFAFRFTKHFDDLAVKYPAYAELRNIFDLALAASIIHSESLADRIDWRRNHFGNEEECKVGLGAAPERVESVINHRELGPKHLIVGVSGGVRVDANEFIRAASLPDNANQSLRSLHAAGAPRDGAMEDWWWD